MLIRPTPTHVRAPRQLANNQLKTSFWWNHIAAGDKPIDTARLEANFAADATKDIKKKKKEEVRACVHEENHVL